MEVTRRDAVTLPRSPATVLAVLCDGARLADWNPAFTSSSGAARATTGSEVRVNVRGVGGTLRYQHVGRDRVVMTVRIPGLSETGTWWLEPVPGGTRTTHELVQTGPVARWLAPRTRAVAAWRLERLARRLESPGLPVR